MRSSLIVTPKYLLLSATSSMAMDLASRIDDLSSVDADPNGAHFSSAIFLPSSQVLICLPLGVLGLGLTVFVCRVDSHL